MAGPDDGLSPYASALRSAEPWLAAVSKLTGGTLFGVLGGYALDRWMGWKGPWGLIGLSVLGIGAGFYSFTLAVLRMGKKPPKQ